MKSALQNTLSHGAKVVGLYCGALLGAILGEIEVQRVGNWGDFNPLRAGWAVALGATPEILILARAPMRIRHLALISTVVAVSMLSLGVFSAHSDSSITWTGHVFLLWLYGVPVALTVLGLLRFVRDRNMSQEYDSLLSRIRSSKFIIFSVLVVVVILGDLIARLTSNISSIWSSFVLYSLFLGIPVALVILVAIAFRRKQEPRVSSSPKPSNGCSL